MKGASSSRSRPAAESLRREHAASRLESFVAVDQPDRL